VGRKLPRFEPIGINESRALWVKYRGNQDIERMLLEIAHARQVFGQMETYFVSVQRVWQDHDLGQLVAMEKIRLLLMEESLRIKALAGLMPPQKDEPDEPEAALLE